MRDRAHVPTPHMLMQSHTMMAMGLWRLGVMIVEPHDRQGLVTVQALKSVLLQQE